MWMAHEFFGPLTHPNRKKGRELQTRRKKRKQRESYKKYNHKKYEPKPILQPNHDLSSLLAFELLMLPK
jgi:hypothetical protein